MTNRRSAMILSCPAPTGHLRLPIKSAMTNRRSAMILSCPAPTGHLPGRLPSSPLRPTPPFAAGSMLLPLPRCGLSGSKAMWCIQSAGKWPMLCVATASSLHAISQTWPSIPPTLRPLLWLSNFRPIIRPAVSPERFWFTITSAQQPSKCLWWSGCWEIPRLRSE